jgi:hypothetical protein
VIIRGYKKGIPVIKKRKLYRYNSVKYDEITRMVEEQKKLNKELNS